ncbi:tetratricopeptide repeat protein [Pseudoalteromonas sp. SSM20]|uniref:tetratricopeptide repeat protein n=1 Tax=Pseudoalteromonas sp. SSM20 TaxID=3139394 RepID=UPI003BABC06D
MNNIIELTADSFSQVISETAPETLIALYFYTQQAPECAEMTSMLEAKAVQYSQNLLLAKLNCDVEQALASQLAQQIGLQGIPAILLLKGGTPVDMLPGPQTQEMLDAALEKHLPNAEDLLVTQAQQLLSQGNFSEAYTKAKQAYDVNAQNSKVKLILADICLNIQKVDDADALLATIPMVDQDAYFNNLKAKVELAQQAKDSPEIKQLEADIANDETNFDAKVKLAVQYDQVGRKEEALETLFSVLQKDLAFGDARKMYLDVIATLPDGDELAARYRRKLYSILY